MSALVHVIHGTSSIIKMAVQREMAGVVGKESVQALLESCIISNKIAAELTSCGYQRTGMQCQE